VTVAGIFGLQDARGPTDAAPRVLERRDPTPELMVLRVSRPAGFVFEAGQHVKLGVAGVTHSYSIASAPDEPFLEFFVELVPGGRLTPRLWQLRPGDSVELGARAKGDFLLDRQADHHFMVATVTGIAPFVSILRHEARHHVTGRRFYVLHGASYADELAYRNELETLSARVGFVTYVPAISRPGEPRNAGWTGETGRLPSIASKHAELFELESGRPRVYACGHPAMVAAIHAQLETANVPVATEAFFMV
jgi:ferredoxin-NADP reductase